MVKQINVLWNETKRNVEDAIEKYIYFCLSVDKDSTSKINSEFLLDKLELYKEDVFFKINNEERKKRIDYINYVRFSFNKLTNDERKIIYWTYLDKENSYDDRFIANSLGFSLGYYYVKKKETLIRFAYSLGVEKLDDK